VPHNASAWISSRAIPAFDLHHTLRGATSQLSVAAYSVSVPFGLAGMQPGATNWGLIVKRATVVPSQNSPSTATVPAEQQSAVPEDVRTFVCEHVRSLENLVVLLRVAAPPVHWWSASYVAEDLGMPESTVEDALQTLFVAGVLIRTSNGKRYGYRPSTAHMHELVNRALKAYREQPVEMVRCMTSRAVTRVRMSLTWLTQRLLEDASRSADPRTRR
jgi:hypothetical protein